MTKYVYSKVGRQGLCNMLYPWARALCFARDHSCQMIAPSWTSLMKVGPWIRGERDKRYYLGQFTNDGYISGVRKWTTLAFCKDEVRIFSGKKELFDPIRNDAKFIRDELLRIANPAIRQAVETLPSDFVGVHIRQGDFVNIGFALSQGYYLRAIDIALERAGRNTPILVFSDGKDEDLRYLRRYENLRIMRSQYALQDMLSLSKAKILVATNRSTFSGWANFLGGMPSLWSRDGELPSESIGICKYELV